MRGPPTKHVPLLTGACNELSAGAACRRLSCWPHALARRSQQFYRHVQVRRIICFSLQLLFSAPGPGWRPRDLAAQLQAPPHQTEADDRLIYQVTYIDKPRCYHSLMPVWSLANALPARGPKLQSAGEKWRADRHTGGRPSRPQQPRWGCCGYRPGLCGTAQPLQLSASSPLDHQTLVLCTGTCTSSEASSYADRLPGRCAAIGTELQPLCLLSEHGKHAHLLAFSAAALLLICLHRLRTVLSLRPEAVGEPSRHSSRPGINGSAPAAGCASAADGSSSACRAAGLPSMIAA